MFGIFDLLFRIFSELVGWFALENLAKPFRRHEKTEPGKALDASNESVRDSNSDPSIPSVIDRTRGLPSPIAMDGATCLKTNDGGVVIRRAQFSNWLAIIVLVPFEFVLLGLIFSANISNILYLIFGIVLIGAALITVARSLRQPSIDFNANSRILEIGRGSNAQRIPFSKIAHISAAPRTTSFGGAVFQLLLNQVLGIRIQVMLANGQVIELGSVSGEAIGARARADAIAQLVAEVTGAAIASDANLGTLAINQIASAKKERAIVAKKTMLANTISTQGYSDTTLERKDVVENAKAGAIIGLFCWGALVLLIAGRVPLPIVIEMVIGGVIGVASGAIAGAVGATISGTGRHKRGAVSGAIIGLFFIATTFGILLINTVVDDKATKIFPTEDYLVVIVGGIVTVVVVVAGSAIAGAIGARDNLVSRGLGGAIAGSALCFVLVSAIFIVMVFKISSDRLPLNGIFEAWAIISGVVAIVGAIGGGIFASMLGAMGGVRGHTFGGAIGSAIGTAFGGLFGTILVIIFLVVVLIPIVAW